MAGLTALSGLVGCAEPDGTDTAFDDEDVGEAAEELQTPTCVTIRRGVLGDVHDAFLSGDYPTWRTGPEQSLWTGLSGGGNENRILMQFDLDDLPPYSIVTSALFTHFLSWTMFDTEVRAHEVLAPWNELIVTSDTFPVGGVGVPVVASYQTGSGGPKTLDLTDLVAGWVSGASPNNGVLLEEDPIVAHHSFSSESGLAVRPLLDVCYVSGVAPHAGGALVAGGVSADSESFHFVGSMGQPGGYRMGQSQNYQFVGGIVGATQEQ